MLKVIEKLNQCKNMDNLLKFEVLHSIRRLSLNDEKPYIPDSFFYYGILPKADTRASVFEYHDPAYCA